MDAWKIAGTAVIGLDHEEEGKPCQDYVIHTQTNELSIMILADGASTCQYGAFGARKACDFIKTYFIRNYKFVFNNMNSPQIKEQLIYRLRRSLNYHAQKKMTTIKELSSTLLFVVVYKDWFLIGHIGDGVIGMLHNNKLRVISTPENAEFANVTYFTSSPNLKDHFRIRKEKLKSQYPAGFILMSDGSAKSLYNRHQNVFSSGVIKLFYWLKTSNTHKMNDLIEKNLSLVLRQNTRDDCSLGVMLQKNE